jgi:ribosomal protein L9
MLLQDKPEMGLVQFQVAKVAPGAARNHLVPSGAAVYGHYLNKQRYVREIERVEAQGAEGTQDVAAVKAQLRKARILKRLSTLKVVRQCFRL